MFPREGKLCRLSCVIVLSISLSPPPPSSLSLSLLLFWFFSLTDSLTPSLYRPVLFLSPSLPPPHLPFQVQETVAKTPNKNSTETGLSPIIIALATGGVFVAVALVALVVRKVNCGKGKEEPRGGGQASKVHADVTCSRMQHGVSQVWA